MTPTRTSRSQSLPFGLEEPADEIHALCNGLSGQQCMTKAIDLIENYDYESAKGVLQLAVLRSQGSVQTLEALSDFLVSTYGRYDAVISLLESTEGKGIRTQRLEHALALSFYHLNRFEEAQPYFQRRMAQGQATTDDRLTLGHLLLEQGREAEALRHLRDVEKERPGEPKIQALIHRAEDVVGQHEQELVVAARAAFKKGDYEEARRYAREASEMGMIDPELNTLLKDLREAEQVDVIDKLRVHATTAMEKGLFAEAMNTWRELLAMDAKDEEANNALGSLKVSSDKETFLAHMGRARDAMVANDLQSSFRFLYHAYLVPGGAKWLVLEEPAGLIELLVEYLETSPRHPERGFHGLMLLDQAERSAGVGDVDKALSMVRTAAEELGDFTRATTLLQKLESGVQAARGARAEKAYKAGISLEKAGMTADAIRALDEAIRLNGGAYRDAVDRRDLMRRGMEETARTEGLVERMEGLLKENKPMEARELLARLEKEASASEIVTMWAKRIDDAVEVLFPIHALKRKKGAHIFAEIVADGEEVCVFPLSSEWVGCGSEGIVVVSADLRTRVSGFGLSSLWATDSTTQFFVRPGTSRLEVVSWSSGTGALGWFREGDGALKVESVVTSAEELRGVEEGSSPQSNVAVSWENGSLLTLESEERNGRMESVLHRTSLARGRVTHTERYGVGLHCLRPLWGTDHHIVSRTFDPTQRLLPGWYHGGVLDGRGRLLERWLLDGPEFEIHTIRGASLSATSNWVYAQYWPLDPFTGRAAGAGDALFVLKDDRRLFFQTREPAMLLGPARSMTGCMRLLLTDDGDRLLLPWLHESGEHGVAVVDGESMRLCGHLSFSKGWTLHELVVNSLGNVAVGVLSNTKGEWRLEPIQIEKAKSE